VPLYAWKGLDGGGKTVSGTREADGPKALRQVLRKDAVFLTELREVVGGARAAALAGGATTGKGLKREVDFKRYFERVRSQEVAVFTRQLATLLKAGIPLAEALGALTEQSDNKKFQMILGGHPPEGERGRRARRRHDPAPEPLSRALHQHGALGGDRGKLDAVLTRLADFMDQQHALRSKVRAP
jgi:general secretion pathway protein F